MGGRAGPGQGPVTLDVDSTICETYGLKKQGARFGYTSRRGYHPLLATVAGTEEVVGVRLRGGNAHTGRGVAGFLTRCSTVCAGRGQPGRWF